MNGIWNIILSDVMQLDSSYSSDLQDIVPVILAGGTGRRLWPLSHKSRPKQFIKLGGSGSFFQKTLDRVKILKPPVIVCNYMHRNLIMQHMKDYKRKEGEANIIIEPVGRNTAPAISVAAHFLDNSAENNSVSSPLMLVLPSDHMIDNPEFFLQAVEKSIPLAKEGLLVIFGIKPDKAETRYGYIQRGASLGGDAYKVSGFVEKPPKPIAKDYIKHGGYYWNSGIFLFSADSFLRELQSLCPDIYEKTALSVSGAQRLQNSVFLKEDVFCSLPSISIDCAVMEHAKNRAVVPVSMGWQDIGVWSSLLSFLLDRT